MARPATARFTDGLSGWLRSALPGVVIDARDEERGRRDRVVDATVYLGAFAIGAATLAGTWEMHSPWLRVVAVVVAIATLVSLHWRRTHPGAVGIGIGAVSLVILPAAGANLAATFNAAIQRLMASLRGSRGGSSATIVSSAGYASTVPCRRDDRSKPVPHDGCGCIVAARRRAGSTRWLRCRSGPTVVRPFPAAIALAPPVCAISEALVRGIVGSGRM